MKIKQRIKYLLNASNRHEAVLQDIRQELDTLRKTTEALSYKSLINDFESATGRNSEQETANKKQ